jgi:nitrite reductase/ring-hydroxylating ferredoxin subunit
MPSNGTPAPPDALAPLDAVPVGGGAIVPGPILLVRPSADDVKAYDAVCPHARTTIGTPDASGVVTCPGHGARFAAADGHLISGPAPSGLQPVAVEIRDGFVVKT